MSTETMSQNRQELWNEVNAERTGSAPVKPAHEPVPVQAPADSAPTTLPPEIDFAAKLTEIENKFSDRLRKAEGHIGNLNGAQIEMKAILEASKIAAQTMNAPSQAAIQVAAKDPAEWEELKADFPEWSIATEKLIESRLSHQTAAQFNAQEFDEKLQRELKNQSTAMRTEIINASLDAVLPDWQEEVKTEGFTKWANLQPEPIKQLIYSEKVGDAAKMLRLYDTARQANPANHIIEQRKATLAAATGSPKGVRLSTSTKSWDDMSPTERWEYERRQRDKAR